MRFTKYWTVCARLWIECATNSGQGQGGVILETVTAEIISVGTEILMGQIVDTNAQFLGDALPKFGIAHYFRQTVGDNLDRLTGALNLALSRSDIVFTIGGLGPTTDDLTREAIAASVGEELVSDKEIVSELKARFEQARLTWTDGQIRQAQRPPCAEPIRNPNGTAPGLICRKGGKVIIALPGPPNELRPMFEGPVSDVLMGLAGARKIESRILRICGLGESVVEQKLGELVRGSNPTIGVYAHPGEVSIRLSASANSSAEAIRLIDQLDAEISGILGANVFGRGEKTLESCVVDLLRESRQSLAVAESCTGGMLGARITSVPGCSDVFWGGAISYSNSLKSSLLGVSEKTLAEHGAVSEECAAEMAIGVRQLCRADWGLAVTGIAGPGGGTEAKPVGTVIFGCAGPSGVQTRSAFFRGIRRFVRERSTAFALTLLREQMLAAKN